MSVTAEPLLVTVQDQFVFLFLRYADHIILPHHRRHVDHEHDIVLARLVPPVEAVNTAVTVIRVKPHEPFPVIID